MKTTKYLLTAAVVSAALFTGCSKKDNNYNLAEDRAMPGPPVSNVTVVLQNIKQRPGYMLQWNSGTLTTADILFTGEHAYGNMVEMVKYNTKVVKSIDLVTPSVTNLGAIAVPLGNYLSGSFGIDLLGISSANSIKLANALYLEGVYYPIPPPGSTATTITDPIPVRVIVNTPVILSSEWLNKLAINRPAYTATMSFNVGHLAAGIDENMLKNAVRTNGTVYITSTSNQNIYKIIVNNLENNLMEVQLSASDMLSAPPVNAANTVNIHAE